MADLRTILEVDFGRETAESAGASGVQATSTVPVAGPLLAHPDGGGGLLGPLPGWVGWEPITATIQVEPSTNSWLSGRAVEGETRWWVEGQGGMLPDYFANGRNALVAAYGIGGGFARIEPALQIDGNALAQAGAPASFRGSVEFRRLFSPSTSGQLLVGDYANDADMNPPPDDLDAHTRRVLNQLRYAGSSVNVSTSSSTTRLVQSCAATFSDPWGRVWLGPGDLGIGENQLPPDVGLQSASRLRAFPSIFLRRTSTVRGVRSPTSASDNPVNTPQSAARLIITRDRPAFSRWRLFVDKRLADVWVQHPEGSDLRTPLAVWNAVFAADALSRAHADPFPVWRFIPDLPQGRWVIQGNIARLTFLEAAEFVGFAHEDGRMLGQDQPPPGP